MNRYEGIFAALAGIPDLHRGLCVGDDPRIWDETVNTAVIQRNQKICGACPELAACGAWARNLGRNKLRGVVAGRVYGAAKQGDA